MSDIVEYFREQHKRAKYIPIRCIESTHNIELLISKYWNVIEDYAAEYLDNEDIMTDIIIRIYDQKWGIVYPYSQARSIIARLTLEAIWSYMCRVNYKEPTIPITTVKETAYADDLWLKMILVNDIIDRKSPEISIKMHMILDGYSTTTICNIFNTKHESLDSIKCNLKNIIHGIEL